MGESKQRRQHSLDTLEGLVEHADEFAIEAFYNRGEVTAMFIAVQADSKLMAIAAPWTDEKSKVETLKAVRALFEKNHVVRYALISEAWTVVRNLNEPDGPPPSECADRKEVLWVTAAEKDGRTLARSRDIIRNGSRVKLGPPSEKIGGRHQGRMAELLF